MADASLLPDTSWLTDPNWTHVHGVVTLKARHLLLVENLLDLTHETFLHPTSIGDAAVAATPIDVTVDGDPAQGRARTGSGTSRGRDPQTAVAGAGPYGLTAEQREAVLSRDWTRMLELGGSIFYVFKLGPGPEVDAVPRRRVHRHDHRGVHGRAEGGRAELWLR